MKAGLSIAAAAMLSVASALPAMAQQAQFNITGVTAYDPAEILGFASQVLVQRTGAVTAQDLADVVEVIYREDGYFLAEVFVAGDGKTLVVDEGEIGNVVVEGVDADTYQLISSYMKPVVGHRAVTQKEFERAIMLVEDIGAISATAEIDYPAGSHLAEVRVIAQQEDKSFGSATLDNPARQFGKEETLSVRQQFLSFLTPGDMLRLEGAVTSDFNLSDVSFSGAVTYRVPFGGAGTYAEGYLGNVVAHRDASGALVATDVQGNTMVAAIGHPFVRSVDTYGYGIVEARRSATEVDASGTIYDSAVNVIGASWIYGKALPGGGAFEYGLNLSAGQRTTSAAGFDDGDQTFMHIRGGAGYEQPVSWFGPDSTVRAEFWGQYSPNRLPGLEEFHIGGREDERGYAFAEARGDTGISATLELSRDFFPSTDLVDRFRPFGFVDVGYVKNNNPSATELASATFASVGLGFDADLRDDFFLRSYLAMPLKSGPSTAAYDPAIYLSLTKSW